MKAKPPAWIHKGPENPLGKGPRRRRGSRKAQSRQKRGPFAKLTAPGAPVALFRKRDGSSLWFTEKIAPGEYHSHRIRRTIATAQTPLQSATIADSASFGKYLILDGETQSAALDEYMYHESLVHVALLSHPEPRRVLVLGGGEGATTREVLKHKGVQNVIMVDLDSQVIDLCKRHLAEWHQGSFDNPRTTLLIDDARKYIEKTELQFDVIYCDLPSPQKAGPACLLYTLEFYKSIAKCLNPQGLFALQAGSGSLTHIKFHCALLNTLRRVFPVVRPYYVYIPSYDVPWALAACAPDRRQDPLLVAPSQIDSRIKKHLTRPLKFLDGEAFAGLLRVPKYLRELARKEKRVITEKRPVYFM